MAKNLEYYLQLPYRIVLYPSGQGEYAAEVPELPGCISQGQSVAEVYKMIEDAKICWLETALEDGIEIPEPSQLNAEYSGRLNIRIPKSLHRTLVEKAKAEKISLNQYINYQLSKGTGHAFK
ncbi:MAG: toxin-antitoxin system HicB family antitoxin [Syntrophomonadaceae bacterium]|nr:toxin-antitoxin system HicB family antitoxin [Syntrophomonadaceae bacterium]